MSKKDPLFQLFREQEHQLSEMPSPETWQRLERKLQPASARQLKIKHRQVNLFRWAMMAAAGFAMLLFATTFSDIAQTAQQQRAEIIPETRIIPTMVKQIAEDQAFREQHREQLNQSVNEGTALRKILPAKASRPFIIPKRS